MTGAVAVSPVPDGAHVATIVEVRLRESLPDDRPPEVIGRFRVAEGQHAGRFLSLRTVLKTDGSFRFLTGWLKRCGMVLNALEDLRARRAELVGVRALVWKRTGPKYTEIQLEKRIPDTSDKAALLDAGRPMRESAKALAAEGIATYQVHTRDSAGACSCNWSECEHVAKHPVGVRGLLEATKDPAEIDRLWDAAPDLNLAVATGKISGGLIGLDLDGPEGQEWYRDQERSHGPLDTRMVLTGRADGAHVWLRSADFMVQNSAGIIAPGVDIRGEGGGLIAPPSLHRSGKRYAFDVGQPDTIATLPEGWFQAIGHGSSGGRCLAPGRRTQKPVELGPVGQGGRNQRLLSLGGAMRRAGASAAAILAGLEAENSAQCRPPLHEREVRGIAASVAKYRAGVSDAERFTTVAVGYFRATRDPRIAYQRAIQWAANCPDLSKNEINTIIDAAAKAVLAELPHG